MDAIATVITARGFHTHGKEFFAAAEAVLAAPKSSVLPLAFLWGRTIELLLKSYLLSAGVSIQRLKSKEFGHDLVALHKEARARGIDPLVGSDPKITGLMQLLNFEYVSKRLEYREGGMYSIPEPELACLVIRRLVKGLHHHLGQNGI